MCGQETRKSGRTCGIEGGLGDGTLAWHLAAKRGPCALCLAALFRALAKNFNLTLSAPSPPHPVPIHHNGRRSTFTAPSRAPGSSQTPNCCRRRAPAAAIALPFIRAANSVLTHLQRSAALKLDWTKLATQLGLKGQTAAALQSFKKRNDDARRKVTILSEQPQTVDFSYYRSILKNQSVIDDIEKQFNAFKPQTYDVDRQIKAIEAFEGQAVKSAEETKAVVDKELSDLNKTLKNIEDARPFADLTVVCARWFLGVGKRRANVWNRMRSLLHNPILTSAPSSWFPRAAGPFLATRQVSSKTAVIVIYANNPTGEVRRFVRPIDVFFPCSQNLPGLGCITTYCE